MPLDCVGINADNFIERIESNVTVVDMLYQLFPSKCEVPQSKTKAYRILLSRLLKNLPSMLIAMTLKPCCASISRMVKTASYKMLFPTFLLESVLVATWASKSFIVSLDSASPFPKSLSKRRILI